MPRRNNHTVQDIVEYAARVGEFDFQTMMRKYEKEGLRTKFRDAETVSAASGTGWHFKGGWLTVEPQQDTNELMDFIENKLLKGQSWNKTREDRKALKVTPPAPILPRSMHYPAQYKILGNWGETLAADVAVMLAAPNYSQLVMTIARADTGQDALPGFLIGPELERDRGALTIAVAKNLFKVLYGKDLFAPDSDSLSAAKSMSKTKYTNALKTILDKDEFKKIVGYRETLETAFSNSTDFETNIRSLETALRGLKGKEPTGGGPVFRPENFNPLWEEMKIQLYGYLFSELAQHFYTYVNEHITIMPKKTNKAETRNTEVAFMSSIVCSITDTQENWEKMQTYCKVKPAGGSTNAADAKLVPLDKLITQDEGMFTSHREFLLDCNAELAKRLPEVLNSSAYQAQLSVIEDYVNTNTEKVNALVPAEANKKLMLQIAPGGGLQLPTISNKLELAQYTSASARVNPQIIQETKSTKLANQRLEQGLGHRYALITAELGKQNLPYSYTVVIDEISTYDWVHILIDDSDSMGWEGSVGYKNRWDEAGRRLKEFAPLLALAGIKVSIQFLNRTDRDTFDFSKDPMDDVDLKYQKELGRFKQTLEQIFKREPHGGTPVLVPLRKISALNPGNREKHFTFFVTDGDPNPIELQLVIDFVGGKSVMIDGQLVPGRSCPERNTLSVVACAKDDIVWVRNLQKDRKNYVTMLDDYETELARIIAFHGKWSEGGPMVPFNKAIHVGLQATPPVSPNKEKGFFVYHTALACLLKITNDQFSEIQGFTVVTNAYEIYSVWFNKKHGIVEVAPPPSYDDSVSSGSSSISTFNKQDDDNPGSPEKKDEKCVIS